MELEDRSSQDLVALLVEHRILLNEEEEDVLAGRRLLSSPVHHLTFGVPRRGYSKRIEIVLICLWTQQPKKQWRQKV